MISLFLKELFLCGGCTADFAPNSHCGPKHYRGKVHNTWGRVPQERNVSGHRSQLQGHVQCSAYRNASNRRSGIPRNIVHGAVQHEATPVGRRCSSVQHSYTYGSGSPAACLGRPRPSGQHHHLHCAKDSGKPQHDSDTARQCAR